MELIKKTLLEKKRIFIPVLILAFVFSFGFIFFSTKQNSNLSANGQLASIGDTPIVEAAIPSLDNKADITKEKTEPTPVLTSLGKPVRFKIPIINVDTTVEYVGLTPDGAMDSPVGPAPVGWYNLGPRPGEQGSAVIDGHSGWKGGIPAVFDDLYKVKIGDKVYVENDMGVTTTFIVREVKVYNPNADASNVFVSNDGKSHLNLITCTGFWNKILKSHSSRLVVFTDKE